MMRALAANDSSGKKTQGVEKKKHREQVHCVTFRAFSEIMTDRDQNQPTDQPTNKPNDGDMRVHKGSYTSNKFMT